MRRHVVHLGAAVGLLLAVLAFSSLVAWRLGYPAELGHPLLGQRFYDPRLAWHWWFAWGHAEPYRAMFIKALWLDLIIALAPIAVLRLVEVNTDLQVGLDPTRRTGFGKPRQLISTGHVAADGDGVVIGKWGRKVLRDNGDGHVLIMGPSRLGKGAGHVVPTLLSHGGAMLVFDPKHELYAITGRFRRSLGPVYVIDPTDPGCTRYNPLLEIRLGDHLIGDCQMIALNLARSDSSQQREDPFWDKAARALLTALLVHVVSGDDPTLAHLWQCALNLKARRYPVSSHPFVAHVMAGHRDLEGRVRDSINETLVVHLSFLADPLIQETTAGTDFHASELMCSEHPATVFLSIPVADGKRLRPLTSLVVECLVSAMTTDINKTADGRRKRRPVLALLDEFPQLGKLDVIAEKMPVMASYGVRLALVCQDEDQIGALYGQRQAITSNCATICSIAGFSAMSLATVERWGGKHAVRQRSKNLPGGLKGSSSVSQSETRIQLLEAGEMLQRAAKEVLVFTHGVPPCWLPKVRYWKDDEFAGLFDRHDGMAPSAPPRPRLVMGTGSLSPGELSDGDRELLDGVEDLVSQLPPNAQQEFLRRARRA